MCFGYKHLVDGRLLLVLDLNLPFDDPLNRWLRRNDLGRPRVLTSFLLWLYCGLLCYSGIGQLQVDDPLCHEGVLLLFQELGLKLTALTYGGVPLSLICGGVLDRCLAALLRIVHLGDFLKVARRL